MKFQWYVIDTEDASVKGENDVEALATYLENPQYVVLSAQHGVFFSGSRNQNEVLPLNDPGEDDDEDEDEDEGEDPEEETYDDTDDEDSKL